jgi:hypothetical protein
MPINDATSRREIQLATLIFVIFNTAWIAGAAPPDPVSLQIAPPFLNTARFDNGFFVTHVPYTQAAGQDNLTVFRQDGSIQFKTQVWFRDAVRVGLYDATTDAGGRALVGGSATKGDGTSALFLAVLDNSGKLVTAIQTNPFTPTHVCFGPDGSLWAMVRDANMDGLPVASRKDYNIVKRYSQAGALLGSWVPLSSFQLPSLTGGAHPAQSGGMRWASFLRASGSHIAAYFGITGDLYEFSSDGSLMTHTTSPSRAGISIRGFAYTSTGAVYTVQTIDKNNGLYVLDKPKGVWSPVTSAQQVHLLFGSAGGTLVGRPSGDMANVVFFSVE